jgi:hypothetical protein
MARKLVYESDRLFNLYGYTMSHGLLLLRSKNANGPTTTWIDILFRDVRAMEIRAWLNGIRIEEIDDSRFLENERSKPIEMLEPGLKIFSITSSHYRVPVNSSTWHGFVIAGIVLFEEDHGELFGPSALVPDPPMKRWSLG